MPSLKAPRARPPTVPPAAVPRPGGGSLFFGCGICGANSTLQQVDATATEPKKKTDSFLRLAKERRFDEIVQFLHHSNTARIESWLHVSQDTRVSTCECLHALCMYRPTAAAVRAVRHAIAATKGTDATRVTDAAGRTPLHIAVACHCSWEVVQVLLHDENEAVWTLDHANRYPLHWACAKPHAPDDIEHMVLVINGLMEAYAMAVISKDQEGHTPLDLAVASGADPRILKALQFVTNILPKSSSFKHYVPPSKASGSTQQTASTTEGLPCETVCLLVDDDASNASSDGVSSLGSRGASRHTTRRPRSRSAVRKKFPQLYFL